MNSPTKALYLVAFIVPLFAWRSVADDFFKGTRGPTLFQMDNRFSYINQDNDVESSGGNMTLKYWDGQTFGKWAFVNVPLRSVESPKGTSEGLGDIIVGAGPRFMSETLHLHTLTYVAGVFPTADDTTPALGNDRYDLKLGSYFTWLSENSTYDVNLALERTFTGDTSKGNPTDENYAGMLVGRRIAEGLRLGAGVIGWSMDNGGNRVDLKVMTRWDFAPKRAFLELGYMHTVAEETLPAREAVETQLRFNF